MTDTILESIIEAKRREVEEAKRACPLSDIREDAEQAGAPRDFYAAVAGKHSGIRLIAEIKKASPSAGLIRADSDPVAIARVYQDAGAAALSVLTDRRWFSGDLSFVEAVKSAVSMPVLRKDFIVDEYQVYQSRTAGADAILLIAGVLSFSEIESFSETARQFGMASLVEVHDVEQARSVAGIINPQRRTILGINNRDLRKQTTDIHTTQQVAEHLAEGTPFVSESGIKTRDDVIKLRRAGAAALLIGETFMKADDIGEKVRELME
jgi:indole-3-glycerol phosphate synthase